MANKLTVLALLGILSCSICLAADQEQQKPDPKDFMQSGSKFVQDKKYKEAAREFQTAVNLDPNNAEAHLLLGLTLTNLGDFDKAIQSCLKSVELKPSYSGYYNLGVIYSNQGTYDKASEAYQKAIEQNPKSYQAWHQLGKVYATDLKFDKAIEAYQKAAQLNPKFPDAFQGLGSAYYWSGDLTMALQQVDELSKLKFEDKALELEHWIKNKEAKKKKASKNVPQNQQSVVNP